MDQTFKLELEQLRKGNLYRTMKKITGPIGTTVFIDGKELILLSSNNYLGLSTHPKLVAAAELALKMYGTGSGASRLISGNMEIHERLEKKTADFKGTPAAALFSTGYMANLGVITSLVGKGDLILSDELNHASIIDGCRLSGAAVKIYPHRNTDALEQLLSRGGDNCPRRLIVTDGIFSMDGDIAPLAGLVKIAEKYNAWLLVDDAHATGVLGENGRGTVEHFGLQCDRLIQVGTYSKALGSIGGFVAGPDQVIEWIKNKARSFIYSTGLPPGVCGASIAALEVVETEPERREQLWGNIKRLQAGLVHSGFNIRESQTQIIPLVTGRSEVTMQFAHGLFEKGLYAPGIRPPTVPDNQCRIRLCPTAAHTAQQIDAVLEILEGQGRRLGIIK